MSVNGSGMCSDYEGVTGHKIGLRPLPPTSVVKTRLS
jgi:hypothetical protein